MIVEDPIITATQPRELYPWRFIEHDDVTVFNLDIDRPKRPDPGYSMTQVDEDTTLFTVYLLPSEGTPEDHKEDRVILKFTVRGGTPLLVVDSGRYDVKMVFIDLDAMKRDDQ